MNAALRRLPAEMDLVEDRNAPRAIKVGFILRCSVVLLWENLRDFRIKEGGAAAAAAPLIPPSWLSYVFVVLRIRCADERYYYSTD